MNHHIDLQIACDDPLLITEANITAWALSALQHQLKPTELTIRMVTTDEITHLNKTYRKMDKPTNVLAFPANLPAHIEIDHTFLGDVIICPSVLEKEAKEQNKPLEAHYAHIIIHGILHLLGYDHIEENDTLQMQTLEIQLLANLGFENPYQNEDENGD